MRILKKPFLGHSWVAKCINQINWGVSPQTSGTPIRIQYIDCGKSSTKHNRALGEFLLENTSSIKKKC